MSEINYYLAHGKKWRKIQPTEFDHTALYDVFDKIKEIESSGVEKETKMEILCCSGELFTYYIFGIIGKFHCYVEYETNTSVVQIWIFGVDKDNLGSEKLLQNFSPEKVMNYIHSKIETNFFSEVIAHKIRNNNFLIC